MSNEEIIKIKYQFYDENIAQKDVELCGEQVMQLMDAARMDEAIAFKKWCDKEGWVWYGGKNLRKGRLKNSVYMNYESVYKLFKQSI